MRFSDIIAGVALVFAIVASFYLNNKSKKLAAPTRPLKAQIKIDAVTDTKKRPGADDAPAEPTYRGTFVVNDGRVELDTSHFHVRRKSYDDYFEVRVFAARFYEDRLKPVVETGHKITATPVSEESFRQALAEAEAVSVEFRDIYGRIFRSSDLALG